MKFAKNDKTEIRNLTSFRVEKTSATSTERARTKISFEFPPFVHYCNWTGIILRLYSGKAGMAFCSNLCRSLITVIRLVFLLTPLPE